MTYFTAIIGNACNAPEELAELQYKNNSVSLYSDQSPRVHNFSMEEGHVCVCGIGFKRQGNGIEVLDKETWKRIVQRRETPCLGHFSIIRIEGDSVEVLTDPSGIGSVFYYQDKRYILVSTKITGITDMLDESAINWQAAGSIYANQSSLTSETEIRHIKKFLPGKKIRILSSQMSVVRISNNNKSCRVSKSPEHCLRNIINIRKQDISLSLSGGTDSRMLLSYFLSENIDINCHTFGQDEEADVIIARRIAGKLGVKHFVFNNHNNISVEDIGEYLSYNPFSSKIMRAGTKNDFIELNREGLMVIDGAAGEFYRGFHRMKMLIFYSLGLRYPSYYVLDGSIPDIFNRSIISDMKKGAERHLINAFDSFSKQTRFKKINDYILLERLMPSRYYREQSRMDIYIDSFMPLAQKPMIESRNMSGERITEKNTKANVQSLKEFPFVSGEGYQPFDFVKRHILKLMRNNQKRGINYSVYILSNEHISDILHSKAFTDISIFNNRKLKKIRDEFYSGRSAAADSLLTALSIYLPPQFKFRK